MKVNGYEVNVWHDWDGQGECPIPNGYDHCVTLICEDQKNERVYSASLDGSGPCWDWDHDGSEGDIVAFKIVIDNPSDMIIDDHMNPCNSKWKECSLTPEDIERIRVTAPKAYREIDRLLGVIEELREIS